MENTKGDVNKSVQTLEDEFKLIKGELKETLSNIREYLLNRDLPASEYASIMEAMGNGGAIQSLQGKLTMESPAPTDSREEREEVVEEEVLSPESLEESQPHMEQQEEPESEMPSELSEEEAPDKPEGETPGTKPPEYMTQPPAEDMNQATPRVNLLANLTHWVLNAKRQIGREQLATFLEVYGITGNLSPELKELILYLSDITADQSEGSSLAETWSRLMLELHGILTGGDAPRHPVTPFWGDSRADEQPEEDVTEEEKPEGKPPLKLKLVLSSGDDGEKEYCLNLAPVEDNKGTENQVEDKKLSKKQSVDKDVKRHGKRRS